MYSTFICVITCLPPIVSWAEERSKRIFGQLGDATRVMKCLNKQQHDLRTWLITKGPSKTLYDPTLVKQIIKKKKKKET